MCVLKRSANEVEFSKIDVLALFEMEFRNFPIFGDFREIFLKKRPIFPEISMDFQK
jgi:hypothetical protein